MPHRNHVPPIRYQQARHMRDNPTPAEAVIWQYLRCRKVYGLRFRRQSIIYGWIVDFYCPECRLVIEIDGPYHNSSRQIVKDKYRDRIMTEGGFHVLRFSNAVALSRPTIILARIHQWLQNFKSNG